MKANQTIDQSGLFADIGGIIFDLDGTLANTLLDIAAGVNHALASEALPLAEPQAIKGWVGEGYLVLMQRAAPQADQAQLERLVKVGSAYYAAHATDQTQLYPGMPEALKTLNEAGIPLAVLSNKPDPITKSTVDTLCPDVCFQAIIGYRDEATKKPNPALALEIAARMDLPPGRILFVGDSGTDIATARNAGMKSLAVTWGFRSRQQLQAASPDAIIDTPQELLCLLGKGLQ